MHQRGPRALDSLADKIACVLLPRGLGRDAWRFRAFRSAATFMDAWSLFCIVVIHSLGLAKAKRLYQLPSYLLPGVIQIVVALLQYAWWKYQPDHYFRRRPFTQLGNRMMRLMAVVVFSLTLRGWLQTSPLQECRATIAAMAAPPYTTWVGVTFTMAISGTLHAMMNSVIVPLPFAPQAVLQVGYAAVLTVMHALPAAACLELSPFLPQLHLLCSFLNELMVLLVSSVYGTHMNMSKLDSMCSIHGPVLLVLFAIFFFGLIVPVYVAYRLDQHWNWYLRHAGQRDLALALQNHARQQQQQQQQQQEQQQVGASTLSDSSGELQSDGSSDASSEAELSEAAPGCCEVQPPAVSYVLDTVMLAFVGVVCWFQLVMARPLLDKVMWPLAAGTIPSHA